MQDSASTSDLTSTQTASVKLQCGCAADVYCTAFMAAVGYNPFYKGNIINQFCCQHKLKALQFLAKIPQIYITPMSKKLVIAFYTRYV